MSSIMFTEDEKEEPDWRSFFQEEELDEAYARVEKGMEEIEEESVGSESGPSDDEDNDTRVLNSIKKAKQIKQKRVVGPRLSLPSIDEHRPFDKNEDLNVSEHVELSPAN